MKVQAGVASNMPLEWTGHLLLFASPPQAACLPLRGSVQRIDSVRIDSHTFNCADGFHGNPNWVIFPDDNVGSGQKPHLCLNELENDHSHVMNNRISSHMPGCSTWIRGRLWARLITPPKNQVAESKCETGSSFSLIKS